jgi:hypothetical protein
MLQVTARISAEVQYTEEISENFNGAEIFQFQKNVILLLNGERTERNLRNDVNDECCKPKIEMRQSSAQFSVL